MRLPHRGSQSGFTLLEVLVALAVVAIAIFPLLQLTQEAEHYAFDAKFTIVATTATKVLISEKLVMIDPGKNTEEGYGDLSQLVYELDELEIDMDYSSIEYEWTLEEIDLSEDFSAEEEEGDDPGAGPDPNAEDGNSNAGGGNRDEDEIDPRFRARRARITIFYRLDDGLEREMVTETFLPPIPREDEQGLAPIDSVPPNNG